MNSDLSAIAILLPQPLLDRVEQLRRSRNLASIQEALLIVISEYFASQPNPSKANSSRANFSAGSSASLSQMEARLSRTEALLAALSHRVSHLEGDSSPGSIAKSIAKSIPNNVLHSIPNNIPIPVPGDLDDIEDEPDEVLLSFLEPEQPSAHSPFHPSDNQLSHSPANSSSNSSAINPSAIDPEEETYHAAEQAAEKAIAFGRNLGWMIQPDGKAQPLSYEEIEEEPDEILYDFLEPS